MSVEAKTIEMSTFIVCRVGDRELCFVVKGSKAAYQGLRPSRSKSSYVAEARMSSGTVEWTHCASKLIWAWSASGVTSGEVRVSRETWRKAGGSGGAPGTVSAAS